MKEPNLFIIGAAKCGTTALHEYLDSHPNIFMSNPKEPEYFADDFPATKYTTDYNEYLDLFSGANSEEHKVVGESSVLYIYSDVAVKNIQRNYPKAKIIAILRNPIDLMYSSYSQLKYGGGETADSFEEAWELQNDRLQGYSIPYLNRDPKILQYKRFASLGEQVERIYKSFPKDQVLLLFHEDFLKDKRKTYCKVLDFLGLEDDGKENFDLVNTNKNIKNIKLHVVLTFFINITTSIKKYLPKSVNRKLKYLNIFGFLRNRNITFNTKRPKLDPVFSNKILGEFYEDIKLLEKLTGRDLSRWLEERE